MLPGIYPWVLIFVPIKFLIELKTNISSSVPIPVNVVQMTVCITKMYTFVLQNVHQQQQQPQPFRLMDSVSELDKR